MKTEYIVKKQIKRKRRFKEKLLLLIITAALIIRLLFTNSIKPSEKYISAFNSLGNILSGEKELTEAVKDAYTYAFSENAESNIHVSGIYYAEKSKH